MSGIPRTKYIGRWREVVEKDEMLEDIRSLEAEIRRLKERLELGYAFNDKGERIEVPEDYALDGISCRDETIKLLEESRDELRQDVARYRWIEQFASGRWDGVIGREKTWFFHGWPFNTLRGETLGAAIDKQLGHHTQFKKE